MGDWSPADIKAVLKTLDGMDWQSRDNPARLPSRSIRPDAIPAEGKSVQVFSPSREYFGAGGTMVLRSPHLWVQWTVREGHDNLEPTHNSIARTGPSSEAHVYISTPAAIEALVARKTNYATDPVIHRTTGLITGVAGDATEENSPHSLSAYYLRGITPDELRRIGISYYFGEKPADGGPIPGGGVEVALSYAPYTYRQIAATSGASLGNRWFVRGPELFPLGPIYGQSTEPSAVLYPGSWNYVAVAAVGGAARNVSLQWRN